MTDLEQAYVARFDRCLKPLAGRLEKHIQEQLSGEPRIDRISARAKSVQKFLQKARKSENGKLKYQEPLIQIQDQLAARIITFYRSDVERMCQLVLKYFLPVESKDLIPESEWEFGYFGKHLILLVPSDILFPGSDAETAPAFFELQIKTLFQHAWSEANHDLGYKPQNGQLPVDATRKLSWASAQAWGADHIFDELFRGVPQ